jgi:hypothetical protein
MKNPFTRIKLQSLNKQKLPFVFFFLCLGIWLSLSIYGAFCDPDITIMEAADMWDENFIFRSNKFLFLFSGNGFGHQRLYQFLVYFIADSLGYIRPIDYINMGRFISNAFGLLSVITALKLVKNHIKNTDSYFIASLIILHPLFFFYSLQAEPYTMLFFMGTIQLLTYFNLEKNKAYSWYFLIISILGFFTHYYFVILLLAECVNELFCYIRNRKIKLLPFLSISGLSIIFLFQAFKVLPSPGLEYSDGYSIFSWTFILKMLGILWGITPVIFSDSIMYFLSIAVSIIFFYLIIKNSNSVPKIILIYFILLLSVFIFFNIIFCYLNHWSYPIMRHYIHIVLPCTIMIGISINKYKKYRFLIIALILSVFLYSDYGIIHTKYKYDGPSVVNYISQKAENTGKENYITLINPEWAGYGLINKNISINYVEPYSMTQMLSYNSINLHTYKRPHLLAFRNLSLPPLFSDQYTHTAYALRYQIYLDSGFKIDHFENFLNEKKANQLLNNILKKRTCNLNHLEMLFLKDKIISIYNKNRLLLEILYPQYVPNFIRKELRIEDKIVNIINAFPKISYFYLLYINEFILGINSIDTTIQETAVNSMLNNPKLKLKEIKEFYNVKIYTFTRI